MDYDGDFSQVCNTKKAVAQQAHSVEQTLTQR